MSECIQNLDFDHFMEFKERKEKEYNKTLSFRELEELWDFEQGRDKDELHN